MSSKVIYLKIFSQEVVFQTSCEELLSRIKNDFHYFVVNNKSSSTFFSVKSELKKPDTSFLQNKKIWRKSKNSITYDEGNIRYNNYYDELLSTYDYSSKIASLESNDINKLHEVSYLLILSLTAKAEDLLGFHKVHAFSVIYKDVCLVGMMKMGTGKSTMLSHFLKDKEVKLISDDTPIITPNGQIESFPLRLGFNEPHDDLDYLESYELIRAEYGRKYLYSLSNLKNKIGGHYKKVVFIEGFRDGSDKMLIEKSSPLNFFRSLFYHMVIGIGLPIIFEYFWRSGLKDFFVKAKIAILRCKCAFRLINEHDFYRINLSEDPEKNNNEIKKWIDSLN